MIKVVAAVIREGDRIFATERGYGEHKGGWEFPGGKVEPGETSQNAPTSTIVEAEKLSMKVILWVIL